MPIPEKLGVPLVHKSFNRMANDVSFGEDHSWHVLREEQILAVKGIAEIDLIRRHAWAIESID